MSEPLINKIKQFIKNGEAKIIIKDGRIVSIHYRIDDKDNKISLEDLKGGEK